VVGITGRTGAGKTSAGIYLSSRYGFQYLQYSQVLSDWLANDSQGKTRLQEIGWKVMEKGMQLDLNRRVIGQINPTADVAVDGLRHPIDYESLNDFCATSFHLLFIDSPLENRWQRVKGDESFTTLGAFEAADHHAVEQQIEVLRTRATKVIRNEGSLQDFYVSLDDAIGRLRVGRRI